MNEAVGQLLEPAATIGRLHWHCWSSGWAVTLTAFVLNASEVVPSELAKSKDPQHLHHLHGTMPSMGGRLCFVDAQRGRRVFQRGARGLDAPTVAPRCSAAPRDEAPTAKTLA